MYPYNNRWAAVILRDGKKERLAVCDTPEEAAVHYAHAAQGQRRANKALFAELGSVERVLMQKLSRGEMLNDLDWRNLAQVPTDVDLPPEILAQMKPTLQDPPPLHRVGRAPTPIPPAPDDDDLS